MAAITAPSWLDELEPAAPDLVVPFRALDAGTFIAVRREIRRRGGEGSAGQVVEELAAVADALVGVVRRLPDAAFALPGGEADWTVAEAIGHDATARAGLVLAANLTATDRWPASAKPVVPGVPGPVGASRAELVERIRRSQRTIERAARAIEGREARPSPLEHPLVGRLRCGEWLLFAGVHDLMHLEQLHGLEAAVGAGEVAG